MLFASSVSLLDRILNRESGNDGSSSKGSIRGASTTFTTSSGSNSNDSNSSAVLVLGGPIIVLAISIVVAQTCTESDPYGKCTKFLKQLWKQNTKFTANKDVQTGVSEYAALHRDKNATNDSKTSSYATLVNTYYDLATVFYEWGWGSSFHFSPRYPNFESFDEATRRHEYILAAQLCAGSSNVSASNKAICFSCNDGTNANVPKLLDVGCGIGGPARNIARFLQCNVIGITLNPYQVDRGNELSNADKTLRSGQVTSIQGDFMKLPFDDNAYDGVYAIEATCHAPNRIACYQEIYRVLKPGQVFATYEWCLTSAYDSNDAEHARMKLDIEEGNGLPDIITTSECYKSLVSAGFEVLLEQDLAGSDHSVLQGTSSWMTPLQPSWNILSQRFQFNHVGAVVTNTVIRVLEVLRLAPAGTVQTQKILQTGGFALRDAGAAGIFTTAYLLVGRKPKKE